MLDLPPHFYDVHNCHIAEYNMLQLHVLYVYFAVL